MKIKAAKLAKKSGIHRKQINIHSEDEEDIEMKAVDMEIIAPKKLLKAVGKVPKANKIKKSK